MNANMQNTNQGNKNIQNQEVVQGVASKIQLFIQNNVKGITAVQQENDNKSASGSTCNTATKQGSCAKPQQNIQMAQINQTNTFVAQQQTVSQQHNPSQQQRPAKQQTLLQPPIRSMERPITTRFSYPKGIPKSFLIHETQHETNLPNTPTKHENQPNWMSQGTTPQHAPQCLPHNENVARYNDPALAQNEPQGSQRPQTYSPSDSYADNSFANDEGKREGSESPDLLQSGQKRLSAFQRLGPLTQPKKPKLTINLLFNKEQSVREVVDKTEDAETNKYMPVHLRDDLPTSTDPTVSKYIAIWPWKKKVVLRKSVTARSSKSAMILEQEQMEELYEKDNQFIQVSVKGHPPSWNKEDVLDAVLESVKGKSFIPCFIEFSQSECKFLVLKSRQALIAIHKYGFYIRKGDTELEVTISLTDVSVKILDFIPRLMLRKRIAMGYDGERKLNLKEFTTKEDISHFIYFPLNRMSNQTELVQLRSDVAWDYLTELDLSYNRITSITSFDLQKTAPKLKHLDLSHNLLERVTMLLCCRELSLRSIRLEGNPLCIDYIDPDHYVKVVRMMFPSLTEIDGIPIRYKGDLPKSKQNYCPEEAKLIVEKFLEVYFPLLDASHEHRSLIQDLYEAGACMTVTYNLKLHGKCDMDVGRRFTAGSKANGALAGLLESQSITQKARLAVHNAVLVLTLLYGSEAWVCQKKHESKVNAVEMRSLRKLCGVTLADQTRNEEIRRMPGLKASVIKMHKGMLRWFGHVERMEDEILTQNIYNAKPCERRSRGRPRFTYEDQIKRVLSDGYSPMFRKFRNLFLRCRAIEEGETESIDGAAAIGKLINKWPALEHDPFTFTVDVIFHTETITIFRVGGILKLTAESLADDEHLLAFTRTFVLKTNNGAEYKIMNEMVYWSEPNEEYANTAFQITAVRTKNLSLKLETTPDDDLKENLLRIFMKLTDMERKPSERCLEIKNWHLKNALEYFSKLLKLDSLDPLIKDV